jgi:hypothetical protein
VVVPPQRIHPQGIAMHRSVKYTQGAATYMARQRAGRRTSWTLTPRSSASWMSAMAVSCESAFRLYLCLAQPASHTHTHTHTQREGDRDVRGNQRVSHMDYKRAGHTPYWYKVHMAHWITPKERAIERRSLSVCVSVCLCVCACVRGQG